MYTRAPKIKQQSAKHKDIISMFFVFLNGELINGGCRDCPEACGFNFQGQMELKVDLFEKSQFGDFPQIGPQCRGCLAGAFICTNNMH